MEIEVKIPQLDGLLTALEDLRAQVVGLEKSITSPCQCSPADNPLGNAEEEKPKKKRGRGRPKVKDETPAEMPPLEAARKIGEKLDYIPETPEVLVEKPAEVDPFACLEDAAPPVEAEPAKPKITMDIIRAAMNAKASPAERRDRVITTIRAIHPDGGGKLSAIPVEKYPELLAAIEAIE